MKTKAFGLLSVLSVVVAVVVPGGPVEATNFVTVNSSDWHECVTSTARPCMGDTVNHDYYGGYLGPSMGNATFEALYLTYDTTNVNVVVTSPYQSNPWTDIVFTYGPLAGTTVGLYQCDDDLSGWRCDRSIITYDDVDIASYTGSQLRRLACHEIGHSLGLTHGSDAKDNYDNGDDELGCLQTPLQDGVYLLNHGTRHINNNYP